MPLTTFTTGNLALYGGAAVALVSASSPALEHVSSYWYDNTTPFVQTLEVKPKTFKVQPGQTIMIRYKYLKRPGCHGRVTYRLIGYPDGAASGAPRVDLPIADFVAGWASATKPTWIGSSITIPDYAPPGKYDLVWIATAPHCEAAEGVKPTTPGRILESRSLPVRGQILPKESS